MVKILEILGADNKGSYCIVHVLLDNGEEAQVWVGGRVEAFYDDDNGIYKAFVKRG
jgi:hypothetical protein